MWDGARSVDALLMKRLWRAVNDRGATMAEYGLLVGLVAVVSLGAP